jgi:hypothetical protein
MIVSSDNPQDAPARLALLREQIEGMTGGNAAAYISSLTTTQEKTEAVSALQDLWGQYLEMSQEVYQRPSNQYQTIYDEVMTQLLGLEQIATGYQTEAEILIDQLTVLTDIKDILEAISLHSIYKDSWLAARDIPGYAEGTNYVPETGFALLHKGEAVIPAQYNRQESVGGNTASITINVNGAKDPVSTGKAVRRELECFINSNVGRKLVQNVAVGR